MSNIHCKTFPGQISPYPAPLLGVGGTVDIMVTAVSAGCSQVRLTYQPPGMGIFHISKKLVKLLWERVSFLIFAGQSPYLKA